MSVPFNLIVQRVAVARSLRTFGRKFVTRVIPGISHEMSIVNACSDTLFERLINEAIYSLDESTATVEDYLQAVMAVICRDASRLFVGLRAACKAIGREDLAEKYLDLSSVMIAVLDVDMMKMNRLHAVMDENITELGRLLMRIAGVIDGQVKDYDLMDAASKKRAEGEAASLAYAWRVVEHRMAEAEAAQAAEAQAAEAEAREVQAAAREVPQDVPQEVPQAEAKVQAAVEAQDVPQDVPQAARDGAIIVKAISRTIRESNDEQTAVIAEIVKNMQRRGLRRRVKVRVRDRCAEMWTNALADGSIKSKGTRLKYVDVYAIHTGELHLLGVMSYQAFVRNIHAAQQASSRVS